jgi:hypothetical protein
MMNAKGLVRLRHPYAWALAATAVLSIMYRMLAIGQLSFFTPLGVLGGGLIFWGLWTGAWLRSRHRGPAPTLVVLSTLALVAIWPIVDISTSWCLIVGKCDF